MKKISATLHTDNWNNNNLIVHEEGPMCTSATMTLKLGLDNHEVPKTTLSHVQYSRLNETILS